MLLTHFLLCLEFHKRVLQYALGFVLMDCVTCLNSYLKHLSGNCDFGCGFLLLWGFKQVFKVLGLFLLLGFGLKVLKFRLLCDSGGKSGHLRNGICAKNGFDVKCSSKISSRQCRLLKYVHKLSSSATDKLEDMNCDADVCYKATNVCSEESNNDTDDANLCSEESNNDTDDGDNDTDDGDSDVDDDENEHYAEDKEFDVLALRKLIKTERRRANSALLELEKERMSSATAVEESMAMILRLQNEKSLIEMESRQYRRLAEEKLLYYQKVIESLQWIVERHESDRVLLENQLRLSDQNLRLFMKGDDEMDRVEVEESFSSPIANFEDALDHSFFCSLDLDS